MKKKYIILIVVAGIIIAGIAAYVNISRKPTDWKPTFYNTETNPYGTYITYNLLKDIFNDKIESTRLPIYTNLKPNVEEYIYYNDDQESVTEMSFYNTLEDVSDTTAYVFISPNFEIDKVELVYFLDYIALGNNVFISAERISRVLLDTLNIKTHYNYSNSEDSTFTLTDYDKKKYNFKSVMSYTTLNTDSCTNPVRTLAVNSNDSTVFVQMKYGKGNLYLHTVPASFANINMLNKKKYDFGFRCLSYLAPSNKILWDEYQKQGLVGERNMLRVLFGNRSLRLALLISIVGLLLYTIFGAKRTQRIIPIIEPPVNSSVEFLNTISNLYYRKRDYKSIAHHRHQYFLDYIRKHYYISTENIDDYFINALHAKSGMDKNKLKRIFELYEYIMLYLNISNNIFLEYNNLLEEFYGDIKNK